MGFGRIGVLLRKMLLIVKVEKTIGFPAKTVKQRQLKMSSHYSKQ